MAYKKKSIFILLFLVSLVFVLPTLTGYWVKNQLKSTLNIMSLSGMVFFSIDEYSSSVFSSKVKVRVQLNGDAERVTQLLYKELAKKEFVSSGLILNCEIDHGPVIFGGGSSKSALAGFARCTYDKKDVVTLEFGLSNTVNIFTKRIEVISFNVEDIATLSFIQNPSEATFSNGNSVKMLKYNLEKIEIKAKDARILLAGFKSLTRMSRLESGVSVGTSDYSFENATLNVKSNKFNFDVSISSGVGQESISVNSGKVTYKSKINSQKIKYNDLLYGPFNAEVELSGFSESAVGGFVKELYDILGDKLSANAMDSRMGFIGIRYMEDLLKGSPKFSFNNISLKTPDGVISFSASAGLKNNKESIAITNVIDKLPKTLQGNIELKGDKVIFNTVVKSFVAIFSDFLISEINKVASEKMNDKDEAELKLSKVKLISRLRKVGLISESNNKLNLKINYLHGKFSLTHSATKTN